jgi:hypothetical protein
MVKLANGQMGKWANGQMVKGSRAPSDVLEEEVKVQIFSILIQPNFCKVENHECKGIPLRSGISSVSQRYLFHQPDGNR